MELCVGIGGLWTSQGGGAGLGREGQAQVFLQRLTAGSGDQLGTAGDALA